MHKKIIRKVIFPVAGMGIRFLPATKAHPKEMMPIVDKPLIQYAVEEAIEAGIKEIIFVTSRGKRSIEDHFDNNFELEAKLKHHQQEALLEAINNIIPSGVSCVYIRQTETLGLGHAILCAKNMIGDESFAVILPDDLIAVTEASCLNQMIQQFAEVQKSIIAIENVKPEDSKKYGIVGFTNNVEKTDVLEQINQIIEKPATKDMPSSFGVVGRYILTPNIFSLLEKLPPGHNGEMQLTDAIAQLLKTDSVYAYQFKGQRFDCGSKLGYLQAIVSFALKHKEVGTDFRQYLQIQ